MADRRYGVVSLALHQGEILGFAGPIGAGRSEIARGVTRLDGKARGAVRGEVRLHGNTVALRDYADFIARGIVYLSQDRKGDGVFLDMAIAASIAALDLSRLSGRGGMIDPAREMAQAQRIGARLRLKAASMAHPVSSLSGGNQQKVALAKLLAVEPKVAFLDEPTRGRSLLSRLSGARETGLVLIIVALFVIMSLASPHVLTWPNMRAMTMAFSVEAIVVVGMTILLVAGGIDLSVGRSRRWRWCSRGCCS